MFYGQICDRIPRYPLVNCLTVKYLALKYPAAKNPMIKYSPFKYGFIKGPIYRMIHAQKAKSPNGKRSQSHNGLIDRSFLKEGSKIKSILEEIF